MKHIEEVKIGNEFILTKEVDQYRPIYYAGASGDFNPIHIDPVFARSVGMERNVLHGLCSMAWVASTITSWAGDVRALKKLNVRFARPVYPEDVITIKGIVKEIQGNRVSLAIEAVNQRGEKVISHGSGEVELPSLKKA
jgi:acyl dehydratase